MTMHITLGGGGGGVMRQFVIFHIFPGFFSPLVRHSGPGPWYTVYRLAAINCLFVLVIRQ
jgi:hypothetical protein